MTASDFPVVDGAPVNPDAAPLRLRVAHVAQANTVWADGDGDLWPAAWADDDGLYTAAGDGTGFARHGWHDILVGRVDGMPQTGLCGVPLAAGDEVAPTWDAPRFNRKPTGMVAVDGDGDGRDELYLAVQDLRCGDEPGIFDEAPIATVVRSADYGRTWAWPTDPMFTDHVFTTVMFLDLGRSNDGSPWVYAYGIDGNWRTSFTRIVPDPTALFFARVPAASVQDRSTWEFFTGRDGDGMARWTRDIGDRSPVLVDERVMYPEPAPYGGRSGFTAIAQGGVVWNPGLGRYLYSSWSEYTHEFFEAPAPWGPWHHLLSADYGHFPWQGPRSPLASHGGYAPTMPSKFVSTDGRDLWLQSNWFFGAASRGGRAYTFGLRRVRFDPGTDAVAPDADGNLALSPDTWPLASRVADGQTSVLNDGRRDLAEDSSRGPGTGDDVWGYQWPAPRRFDRVVYMPGPQDSMGGWFAAGPRVEVRVDGEWRAVEASVAPPYRNDFTALEEDEYVFDFAEVCADGVRLIGEAGGPLRYTSIAELEVWLVRGRA
ncbi:DUF4185 domain-containing protein [Microbacterium sp. CFH 90308]|uniref:DUF4185 domain-containing protein n=1 Tax=Microbacterium salsuginis TaxID=2722803 RepID=A0ABX1KCB3_9MICO|nr:DUF4185 domain-containing protein [Microbacterium sp. CFH 90308]NLP84673.1 DUF4185 domain-containing protein [Microbacterium sp. CFH 90308]